MLEHLCRWLRRATLIVPLIGRLGEVPVSERKQALYETLTTTIFATMPFWVLPVLGRYLYNPKPTWDEALQRGEGLIYAAALLGPLVYVLTRRYGKFNLVRRGDKDIASPLSMSFPYGGMFVTITALSCAVAGFSFAALQQIGDGIDKDGVRNLSWIMMIGATIIFFLVTAYSNLLDSLEKRGEMLVEEQPRQEAEFLDKWMEAKS